MKLVLKTQVNTSLSIVWSGFDRALFSQLSPPFPPVEVVRFDGCLQGDVVHLRLNFGVFRQDWISLITDQQRTDSEIFFIDEGTRLPFFLRYWRHRHRLIRDESDKTILIDDITYRTPFWLTDYLFYPIMWLLFAYRKPIYRRVFNKQRG
ncbi:SRPBCC family protein [Spirosoma knui]